MEATNCKHHIEWLRIENIQGSQPQSKWNVTYGVLMFNYLAWFTMNTGLE